MVRAILLLFAALLFGGVTQVEGKESKSAREVTLPAQSIKSQDIAIKAPSEPCEVTLSDGWFGIVGGK